MHWANSHLNLHTSTTTSSSERSGRGRNGFLPVTDSLITVAALMGSGILDSSIAASHRTRKGKRRDKGRNGGGADPACLLCRLAEGLGGLPNGKRNLRR